MNDTEFTAAALQASENTGLYGRAVVLRARPAPGDAVSETHCACVPLSAAPATESLADGELLVATLALSVDPVLRCRFNADTGAAYVAPFAVAGALRGAGIGRVIASRCAALPVGTLVGGDALDWPFAEYVRFPRADYRPIAPASTGEAHAAGVPRPVALARAQAQPSLALGVLGLTGATAWLGVTHRLRPRAGELCVVSAAAGATGSVVVELARRAGARVIGIGGARKQALLARTCDVAVSRHSAEFRAELRAACGGRAVDAFFDNTGGAVADAVAELAAPDMRWVLCGTISTYNDADPTYPPPARSETERRLRRRFLALDYAADWNHALAELAALLDDPEQPLEALETVTVGIENTARAFCAMMAGDNVGKAVVQVKTLAETEAEMNARGTATQTKST